MVRDEKPDMEEPAYTADAHPNHLRWNTISICSGGRSCSLPETKKYIDGQYNTLSTIICYFKNIRQDQTLDNIQIQNTRRM